MGLLDFVGNVGLALIFGTLIGVERQVRKHPAGLRTNALVSVGAALFVSLAQLLNDTNSPTRIASYIVSGVGFLGGGVILKEGITVRGLTTAAGLWCSAAVGTLAGTGFGLHGAVGTVFVLIVLIVLRPLANWVDARQRHVGVAEADYQIRVACEAKDGLGVRTILLRHVNGHAGLVMNGITTRKKKTRKRVIVLANVHAKPADDKSIQEIISRLMIEPGVLAARWEKLPETAE
ncbi:MAG TPA: MgtC/SapB family protein [Gemmata sp.]|nr:MgtC/SapB family protein [Gemmata sp.]